MSLSPVVQGWGTDIFINKNLSKKNGNSNSYFECVQCSCITAILSIILTIKVLIMLSRWEVGLCLYCENAIKASFLSSQKK